MRDVKYSALAGNRTPVSRVAGENSMNFEFIEIFKWQVAIK